MLCIVAFLIIHEQSKKAMCSCIFFDCLAVPQLLHTNVTHVLHYVRHSDICGRRGPQAAGRRPREGWAARAHKKHKMLNHAATHNMF